MSIFTKLSWVASDDIAICRLQSVLAGGNLLLNGTLANGSIPNQLSLIANGMIRSVTVTATAALPGGTTFTVIGFQNGGIVSEVITGGGVNVTVEGVEYYDVIKSITVNNAVATSIIKVGTGTVGYLPLIPLNTNAQAINYSLSTYIKTSTLNYSVYQTLDSINTNFIPFKNQSNNLFSIVSGATTSTLNNFTSITNFLLFKVNSSTATTTFDFIFLQE